MEVPLSKDDLRKEFEKVSKELENIGLSSYEAKAYIALVAQGYGNAELIAQTAQIPRTSSYKVLESLQEKGFAIATEGRPRIFKPSPPRSILEMIKNRLDETFEKLELLHEIVSERGEPQLVYTITGREKTLEKIGELLDTSTKSFIIATPQFSVILSALNKKIQSAVSRKVDIQIITAPLQRVPENVKVVRRKGLIATDVISDGTSALIASPDLNACGYTDNKELAMHLERFLQIMIAHPE